MRRRLVPWLLVVLTACSGAPPEDATGAQIYGQLCASCHRADLSGGVGPSLDADSRSVDMSDAVIAQIIRQGRGSRMPAFARTLSAEQLDRLIDYIRDRQAG
jgi:mono/diheme cytochrome c family protein